jgi:hypothetical protein
MNKLPTLPCWEPLCALSSAIVAGNLGQWEKGGEGNTGVSDDSLLDRVAAVAEGILISRLTLDLPPGRLCSQ